MSDDADSGKWLKVKARMPNNQKVIALSDAAFRLHISVSCWCCDEMNDGRFSAHAPSGMPKAPTPKKLPTVIKELVDAGLWRPTEDGYEINDFLKYNMSRAQYEAKREAGRLGGQRSGEVRRGQREAPPEAPASAPAQPKPKQRPSRPEAPPEHENDHDQRSKKTAAAKDLSGSARAPAPAAAAAAKSGIQERAPWAPEIATGAVQAFVRELSDAWGQPVPVLGERDPLLLALVARLSAGVPPGLFGRAGRLTGEWLTGRTPEGRRRTLRMVSEDVLATSFEDAEGEVGRVAERIIELRRSVVPRKTTPPPMTPGEILAAARAASEAVGG